MRYVLFYNFGFFVFTDVSDASELWKFPYESPALRFELEDAWEQIKPLYEQLHAYVRKKLRDLYGPERISREAPLPAHILGLWQALENGAILKGY